MEPLIPPIDSLSLEPPHLPLIRLSNAEIILLITIIQKDPTQTDHTIS
jgi:hypothetical protein